MKANIEEHEDEEEFIKNMPPIDNSVYLKLIINQNRRMIFCKEEDERLKYLVDHYGNHEWEKVAKYMPYRSSRQCRERYEGYLSPSIKKEKFSEEEDLIILEKLSEYGTKWTKIATFLKGRSGNQVKNRYNTYLKYHNQNQNKIQIQNNKYEKNDESFQYENQETYITNNNLENNESLFFNETSNFEFDEFDFNNLDFENDFPFESLFC